MSDSTFISLVAVSFVFGYAEARDTAYFLSTDSMLWLLAAESALPTPPINSRRFLPDFSGLSFAISSSFLSSSISS